MASATGDAIAEEAEAAGSGKKNRRRIFDYLGDSDGGEPASPDTPPQLRLPRFTCATFRFVRRGRKRDGRKQAAGAATNKTEDNSVDSSAPGSSSKPAETSSASAGGGMGLSMLLLLARTCVELNRMAEARAQMEALLKEIKDEAGRMKQASAQQHHGGGVSPGTFNLVQTSSTTTVSSSSCTSDTDTDTNRHRTAETNKEEVARQECQSKPVEDTRVAELEEAEFEAEPAQHSPTIQWSTEQGNSAGESSDEEFIELDGGRFVGGIGDHNLDAGDEDSDEEESAAGAEDEGGVSAVELERRLHELLHQRDRDRIEELESALRRAEQKLREKEMEARLWQDTATLALQPPPRDGP